MPRAYSKLWACPLLLVRRELPGEKWTSSCSRPVPVYAIEVKAEENLRAKSLRSFKEKYPEAQARRFSLSDYREQDWLTNVPLYLMGTRDFGCSDEAAL